MLRRLNFSLWYFFHPPWDSGISPPELLEFISEHPAGRAIDLGCGTGTNVITLAQHGWQVTGVDFAPRAIHIARQKLAKAGVEARVEVGDVTELRGIAGPFDLALDLGCFHGIPRRAAYLAQLKSLIRPGGHWLLYAMLKDDAADPRPGLTEADIEQAKSSGFTMLSRTDGWDKRGRASAWFLLQRAETG